MANFNKVMLMGNMTRDPELRYLPSNMPVVSFGLAVNERWKDKNSGEWQERANFFDCEAFGRGAEVINQYMTKGRPLFIEGKLRMDTWDDKQTGQKRSKVKIVVDNFQFIGGRDDQQGGNASGGGERRGPAPARGNAGGGYGGGNSGGGGGSGGRDQGPPPSAYDGGHEPIDEDDIPF